MATERELGAVLGRYETDNRRRRKIAVIGVPAGAALTAIGMMVVLSGLGTPAIGVMVFPAFATGIGLGVFVVGVWQALLSVTRTDEAFTLHEGGFVHSYAGKSWAIAWDEIADVKDNGRDTMLQRALGGDVRYRVKLRSPVGRRRSVTITGFTTDAVELTKLVEQAVVHDVRPTRESA